MNGLKTTMLLAALTALFMALGYTLGRQSGMLIAFLVAIGMNIFTYWNADKIVLKMHNAREVDAASAPDFYGDIITTRDYQDRLDTLARVRSAGVKVCCGGIVGMGETRRQRAGLVAELANLTPYPESVPINNLVKIEGTPLAGQTDLDPFEFVRTIAVARITMPTARVRLSAGRQQMGDAVQALCFLAGANSIFYGDKLLVTGNPDTDADVQLLVRLGMRRSAPQAA